MKDEVTGRDDCVMVGDFDDRPSDYEFSEMEFSFGDRTEKPKNAGGETLPWITQIEEN